MKEFDNDSNEVEIVEERQQRKELRLIGQQRKIRGLTLFEYNEKTKQIQPAKYKPVSIYIHGFAGGSETTETYKCVVNENCIYVQALNKENAMRKINKR